MADKARRSGGTAPPGHIRARTRTNACPTGAARNSGRPTRAAALERDARLLAVATRLFMERGFDGTSIDAVAEAAGVSKPTVYTRYRDKRDLFAAVLEDQIATALAQISAAAEQQARAASHRDIASTLHQLSRTMTERAQEPELCAVQRILIGQMPQFPELARIAHEEGWLRAVRGVAELLAQFQDQGQVQIGDVDVAAEVFMNLVIGSPGRIMQFGIVADPRHLESVRRASVEMFLRGLGQDGKQL